MSTRKDKLEKNILPVWEEISSKIKSVSTVGLSTADRDEIAHFKKVFAYIYEMLKSIDPDLYTYKGYRINTKSITKYF